MAESEMSAVEKAKQIHHYNLAWGVFVELDGPDSENIKTTSNEDTNTITIRLEGYPSECKETHSGSVLLHDDVPAALVTLLRFVIHGKPGRFSEGSGQDYFGLQGHEWINATFIAADKYDVADLRDSMVEQIRFFASATLLEDHYFPLKEAYGGTLPEILYSAFAQAMSRHRLNRMKQDGIRNAAIDDIQGKMLSLFLQERCRKRSRQVTKELD